jgi:hypothetical protein
VPAEKVKIIAARRRDYGLLGRIGGRADGTVNIGNQSERETLERSFNPGQVIKNVSHGLFLQLNLAGVPFPVNRLA